MAKTPDNRTNRNKPDSFYTFREGLEEPAQEANIPDESDLPGSLASLLPLVVPIVLILSNTTCSMLLPEESPILALTAFIGDSNVALAIILLGKRLGGLVAAFICSLWL